MNSRIQAWGNSQGVRLSKELLARAGMQVGEEVSVAVHDGTLVITPVRRVRGGHDLRELVACIPEGYEPDELEWGEPVGREAW
jgi:antitoxin MazE